jgi:hypothetical protein
LLSNTVCLSRTYRPRLRRRASPLTFVSEPPSQNHFSHRHRTVIFIPPSVADRPRRRTVPNSYICFQSPSHIHCQHRRLAVILYNAITKSISVPTFAQPLQSLPSHSRFHPSLHTTVAVPAVVQSVSSPPLHSHFRRHRGTMDAFPTVIQSVPVSAVASSLPDTAVAQWLPSPSLCGRRRPHLAQPCLSYSRLCCATTKRPRVATI